MDVQYQCDLDDYVEAQNFVLKQSVSYYILFVGGGFSLVLGLAIAFWGRFANALPALFLGIFWLGYLILYRTAKIRHDFKRHPNVSRQCSLQVDDNGLRSASDVSTGETKWGAFVKYRETPNLFMVYFGGRMFRVIPKRAFSTLQLEEFRELLRRKLPAK